jgi:hypothetical protein
MTEWNPDGDDLPDESDEAEAEPTARERYLNWRFRASRAVIGAPDSHAFDRASPRERAQVRHLVELYAEAPGLTANEAAEALSVRPHEARHLRYLAVTGGLLAQARGEWIVKNGDNAAV